MLRLSGRTAHIRILHDLEWLLTFCRKYSSSCALIADRPIHFALLLPMTGRWSGGSKVAGAAAIAVERVNADITLLPGRVLEFSWADSGCSAKQGLAAMGKLLQGESKISAVVGPACHSACEVTSHLSGGQGIPQISWGCTSPELSNTTTYELVRSILHTFIDPSIHAIP